MNAKIGNTVIRQTWTPAPMAAALYDEFPEIEAVTRIADWPQTLSIGGRYYDEPEAAYVDSTFSDIFTLELLEGSPGKVLNEPGQVLLDRSTARKYFGDAPACDSVIYLNDTLPLTVKGVYRDFPSQSHFHFNILISLISAEGLYNSEQWFANNFETYLRLADCFPEVTRPCT